VDRKVVFSPEAREDLDRLYDFIADRAGPQTALAYTERIMSHCANFAIFPERGMRRDDIRPGLRVIGFERRVTIAFHVTREKVMIDRVFYGGQNWEAFLADTDETLSRSKLS
jgi:toxin ParE1/3/4